MLRWLLVCISLWVALPAWAASVSLSVSTSKLAVSQATRATVTVLGAQPVGIPVFEPVDGLSLRYVTQTSTPVSTVDQGIVYARRYVFEVEAERVGTYALGPAEVALPGGATVASPPVTITVTERSAEAQDAPLVATSRFLEDTVWEGEVVLYTAEVRARKPIRNVAWALPKFEGLQQVGQGEERQYGVLDPSGDITVNDVTVAMLASGTGDRTQAPAVARVSVLQPGGGPWGLPQTRTRSIAGQEAPLTVRPLPPPPPGFNGLVGDYDLRSSFGTTEGIAVGQSVPWVVEIVGDGVVDGVELPIPELPEARIYRDTTESVGRLVEGRWMARKRFQLVLVPTAPGTLELPPLELVTFSPSQGRYVTVKAQLGTLTVVGEGARVDVQTFGADGEIAGPEPVDLVDIYGWGPATTPPLAPLIPFGLVLAVLPGVLVLGLDGRDGVRSWWSSRTVRRAVAVRGRGRLRSLPSEPSERLAVLDLALREALADHVSTPVSQLRRAEALDAVVMDTRTVVEGAFTALDLARFAGGAVPPDVDELVRAAIDALETR